jgi:hypothetical protein
MVVSVNKIIEALRDVVTLPFRISVSILNAIPLNCWELHGLRGNSEANRPDLRDIYAVIKGKKQIHLGFWIIAYLNGYVVSAVQGNKQPVKGIYAEDLRRIIDRWGL